MTHYYQPDLTQALLKEHLFYDPATGHFKWIKPRANRVKVGATAGYRKEGYIAIKLFHKRYYAHRLAFLYMEGRWPTCDLDHVDRDGENNRWENLREATRSENCRNKRVANRTGFMCVALHSSGNFSARVKVHGIRKYLGMFPTKEAAAEAVMAAKVDLHKEFSIPSPEAAQC